MQNTSADYKVEINKPSRSFECKVTIGDTIYTNEDIVDIILDYPQATDGFTIGNTISQSLDLTLINRGDIIYSTSQVKVEIGLKIGSKIEYILMGYYNIDDVEKTDYTTKLTCYDNMIKFETAYFSELSDKPTLQQVVNELIKITGIQFEGSLPAYIVSKLGGFSCREVLSYVASICGGNALITRSGKFTVKGLSEVNRTIDGNNYFEYKREEVKYKVGQVSCQVDENNILSKGSLGSDSMELQFENPWVTESILNDIYNKLNGYSYLGYFMKYQGDLSLDPCDIITVTDVKNVTRKIPILSQKFTYNGGLTSEIGAKGETKNKNSFSSSGSTTNKVNRLVTEQAVIKEALIEKANIKDLKATNAEVANLKAKDVEIENALIKKATIEQLNVVNANIEKLVAADATINNALINKADITQLNAVNGKINVLESDTANIKNLLAGNISGESGQLIHLTASNVVIADAVIKSLIASKISVEDLQAGTISTNKFSISSTDGGLSIVGPTMQFKDKNNKVRIQMGQDTQGNFNFILRGEDGTTTLIDHTGIKEKAIADNLIKENMVAADAIGEKQINYSSLITGLNKDTNTSLIKASKVAIDLTGQSLEVAFNSLKSNVDNIEIGGRNLLKNTSKEFKSYSTGRWFANISGGILSLSSLGLKAGDTITFRIYIKATENRGARARITHYYGEDENSRTYTSEVGNLIELGNEGYSTVTTTLRADAIEKGLYLAIQNEDTSVSFASAIGEYKEEKLEKGNKATDYTEAPEDTEEKIEANTTAISVAQGEIEGLISENSIIKGNITTISDKYTSLKATVDGINTTVASHTSSIGTINTNVANAQSLADSKAKVFTSTPTTPYKIGDLWVQGTSGEIMKCKTARASGSYVASDWEKASKYTDDTKANTVEGNLNTLSGKVTTVENSYASLSQNLEGFKTTVGNTYSTKSELSTVDGKVSSLTNRVSTAESSITQLNNKIALKVEATDITEAINSIQVGGRNLYKGTKAYDHTDTSIWNFGTRGTTTTEKYMGCTVVRIVAQWGRVWQKVQVKPNTEYTLSAWVKSGDKETSPTLMNIYGTTFTIIDRHNWTASFAVPREWVRVSTVIRTKSDTTEIDCRYEPWTVDYATNSPEFFICGLKLEEGNQNTDYTEAPEDIESAISTVDSKVTTTSNKVATIETNLSSITQRVSSTESTISTHTTQLGTVDSRINTAKNSAISTAASDATSKANAAQTNATNSAKSYTDGQITTVNKTITDKVAEIKTTTDSITSRVSSTESSISTINGNVSSLQSRMSTAESKITSSAIINTVSSTINTAKQEAINSANSSTDSKLKSYATTSSLTQTANNIITKFEKTGVANLLANSSFEDGVEKWSAYNVSGGLSALVVDSSGFNKPSMKTLKYKVNNFSSAGGHYQYVNVNPNTTYTISGYIRVYSLTSQTGRSIGISITEYNGEVATGDSYLAEFTDSTINQSLWRRVTRTFTTGSNTSKIQVFCRVTKINVGEIYFDNIKLEKGEIATEWIPGNNEVIEGNTKINAEGVTIYNGALTIKDKNNKNVVKADADGNLEIDGIFRTYTSSNNKAVEIIRESINLYDWVGSGREEPTGKLYSGRYNNDNLKPQIALANDYCSMLALASRNSNDGTGSYYIVMDKFKIDSSNYHPISIRENTDLRGNSLYLNQNKAGRIYGTSANAMMLNIGENSGEGLAVYGKDGNTQFMRMEKTYTYPITMYQRTRFTQNAYVDGSFTVKGTKSCVEETKSYGERLMMAYELPSSYYGDIGSGVTDENGECVIFIDDVVSECINTNTEYQVFLQTYGEGTIWVEERKENYFIVRGTKKLNFGWELKALRKNRELERNLMFNNDYIPDIIEFEFEADKESREILENELNFELDDYLLN